MRDEALETARRQRPERRTPAGQSPGRGAPDPRRPPSREQLLALQRTAGNRATSPIVSRARSKAQNDVKRKARTNVDGDYVPTGARVRKAGVGKQRRTPGGKKARLRRELDRLRAEVPTEYRSERFGAHGERVTVVSIPVSVQATGGRGAAPPPLSEASRTPADTTAGQKSGYDGGHVIGLRLGGVDASMNVVPMYRAFNRGPYSRAEADIKMLTGKLTETGVPVLTVTCGYPATDSDVPTTLTLELTHRTSTGVLPIKTWTLTQPDDIPAVPDLSAKKQKLFTDPEKQEKVRKKAARELRLGKVAVQDVHLPRSDRAEYPDDPQKRIYEYLDLLQWSGKLDVETRSEAFKGFSADQRTLILQANKMKNGGVIKSDDPQDPVYRDPDYQGRLDERGTDNFPEIDHIIPQVLGGSNAYSNARVVSWRLNNVESRIKPIHDLIDTSRLAPPTFTATPSGYREVALQYLYRKKLPAQDRTAFAAEDVHAWAATGPGMLFPEMTGVKVKKAQAAIAAALQELVAAGTLASRGNQFSLPAAEAPTEEATAMDTT